MAWLLYVPLEGVSATGVRRRGIKSQRARYSDGENIGLSHRGSFARRPSNGLDQVISHSLSRNNHQYISEPVSGQSGS